MLPAIGKNVSPNRLANSQGDSLLPARPLVRRPCPSVVAPIVAAAEALENSFSPAGRRSAHTSAADCSNFIERSKNLLYRCRPTRDRSFLSLAMAMETRKDNFQQSDEISRIFPRVGSTIWCRVTKRTALGAELSVFSVLGIPKRFVLIIADTGERFLAETVRTEERRMSVRLRAAPAFGTAEAGRVPVSATVH